MSARQQTKNPLYLVERHGITENEGVLQKISGALDKMTAVAIAK